MQLYSFMRQAYQLNPVEVEISFVPGLPQIHFLGLPDTLIRESELRIKSAIRHQGFQWPRGQKILVHLKPNHQKKSSRGLDLAVAAGILWHTRQATPPTSDKIYLYGELSLNGEVAIPDDLDDLSSHAQPIYSGSSLPRDDFDLLVVKTLKELDRPTLVPAMKIPWQMKRPPLASQRFSTPAAKILSLIATGEHSTLLAGPAGSGKSTMAHALHTLLRDPEPTLQKKIRQIARFFGHQVGWRPFVSPHHTASCVGMVGGGHPILPGEITRAHGGVLLLDEFLEFPTKVQEALREPIESGVVTVRRAQEIQIYPAKFLLLATTNLCPCGEYVPHKQHRCHCRLNRRRNYLERLSGPILDRFQIIGFSHEWGPATQESTTLEELFKLTQEAIAFAVRERNQTVPNGSLDVSLIEKELDSFTLKHLIPSTLQSYRRYQALLRVARTLADLEQSSKVSRSHLEQAAQYCIQPALNLKGHFW